MTQHPDPIFLPVELAIIHGQCLQALDDLFEEEERLSTGEVDEEEAADQVVLEVAHIVDILRKIEKRIIITPSLTKPIDYSNRIKELLGDEVLTSTDGLDWDDDLSQPESGQT